LSKTFHYEKKSRGTRLGPGWLNELGSLIT